jgi:hypothetical protein
MAPSSVPLAAVFAHYLQYRPTDQNATPRAFKLILAYLKTALNQDAATVADFSLTRQQGFMRWAATHDKLKVRTIATYLTWAQAALNWAATPHVLTDSRGREREGQLISNAPKIAVGDNHISQVTGLPVSQPRSWLPTDAGAGPLPRCHPWGWAQG